MHKTGIRKNLKLFRIKLDMTQEEISDKIGCIRATYSAIECGQRNGRPAFWDGLQKAFNLSAADMQELKTIET